MTSGRLRLAFAGTPEIARRILESLLKKNEHDIELVLTQPDRPAGRGRKLKASEVKTCALEHSIPVEQPHKSEDIDSSRLTELDCMLVVAFGILLKAEVLQAPRLGCINIHTSLLPRWRGAAPIQRAIEAGDSISGISIMQMDEGLDTGPVLWKQECAIYPYDTAGMLHDRLVELAMESIHAVLRQLADGTSTPSAQDDAKACYAGKISKADANLDWSEPATELERKIRAFNPFPVAHAELQGKQLRIWKATVKPHQPGQPGNLVMGSKDTVDVITGDGVLGIQELQLPGKKSVTASDFINGHPDFFNH